MINRLLLVLPTLATLAAAPATQPEIRRGEAMSGSPRERSQRYFQHLAHVAEPTGHADPSRLASYVAILKREVVHDPRLIAFSPTASVQPDGGVLLEGFAEYPELQTTAAAFLHAIGFARVEDHLRVVPADVPVGLRVTANRTFFYDRPAAPHEKLTEAVAGDVLFPLFKSDGMYLCHSAEGYLGYVNADDVRAMDQDALVAAMNASPPSEKIEKIIAAANTKMGVPYVWGGLTGSGIDCSGLVYAAFASQGILLPRDADQQALCGTMVATRSFRSAMRKGDLMFFVSQRGSIHHVAIYLGDDKFIEAADPGVKISSLNPKDKEYAPKRDHSFSFAKRVLK